MSSELKEIANKKEPTRIILKGGKTPGRMVKAYEMMDELNKIEQPYLKNGKQKILRHRVGLTTDCQLIIDIDNHNETALKGIIEVLVFFFPDEYVTVKTLNGYQIISKTKEKSSFEWKNIKILNTKIEREHDAIYKYKEKLIKFLADYRVANPNPPKTLFNEKLKASGLINPIGDFDFLYNVLGILNGHYSIRLTPKVQNDKWIDLSEVQEEK